MSSAAAPHLPPEMIDEVLSTLLTSLSDPSVDIAVAQATLVSVSMVNRHFYDEARKGLLQSFPLTTLRTQCAFFTNFVETHGKDIHGLRIIQTHGQEVTNAAMYLSDEEAEGYLVRIVPLCQNLQDLDLNLGPRLMRLILELGIFASLRTLQRLRLARPLWDYWRMYQDQPDLHLPSSLIYLEANDVYYSDVTERTITDAISLRALNLQFSPNWLISTSICSHLQTLHYGLSPLFYSSSDHIEKQFHPGSLSSLTPLHINFKENEQKNIDKFSVLRSFLLQLPNELKVLHITDCSGMFFTYIPSMFGQGETPFALQKLKRLELNGGNTELIEELLTLMPRIFHVLGIDKVDVVWVPKGAPFGGW